MMRKWQWLPVLILLWCCGWKARAQDPRFIRYTTENGLPSNTVYSIIRDKSGFLWFATDRGIARFNGLTFERFSTADGLKDNEAFTVTEDNNGRIWINSYNGKLCYFKNGKFYNESNTPFLKLPFKLESLQTSLLNDSSVVFYFGSRLKYAIVKGDQLRIIEVKERYKVPGHEAPMELMVKDAVTYDLVYQDRIVTQDTSGRVLATRLLNPGQHYLFFMSELSKMYLYANGDLFDSDEKLVCHLPDLASYERKFLSIQKIRGTYFISCLNGLIYNTNTWLLKGKQVTSVATDISGNYWISTLKHGVYKMDRDPNAIREYSNIYSGPLLFGEAMSNYIFYGVSFDSSLHWVHTGGKEIKAETMKRDALPRMLPGLDKNGQLFSYNQIEGEIVSWVLKNGYVSSDRFRTGKMWVKRIFTDPGFYNIVNSAGLFRFGRNAAGTAGSQPGTQFFLNSDHARTVSSAEGPGNVIWISTIDSIYKAQAGRLEVQPQYKTAFRQMGALGHYLVGVTEENRLLICNNVGHKVYIDSVSETDCIWDKIYPVDSVHAIISTNNYYRLLTIRDAPDKPRFSISIIENEFIPQQAELICFNNSDCYFFKNGSVVVVSLQKLLLPLPQLKVYFMSLSTDKGNYRVTPSVYITYGESRNISIKFSPLSFDRSRLKFEFSITQDGTDDWAPLSNTELNLLNVNYGTHKVKVRVTGLTGKPAYAGFTLVVGRPFWAQWWFIGICGLLVIAAMVLVIWLISSRILKKRKEKFEVEFKYQTSEFKALNALMNPHFIFNSLNNIQGLINDDNKESANQYLTIFSQLVRQNMHNLTKELISVEREMILVTNYLHLERLRFKSHLNFYIEIEDGIDLQDIYIPPLLIQPIVENAVKHGILPRQSEEGYVHIHLYEQDDDLYVAVEDNGVGITYAQQHKNNLHESTGIENIRKRIAHLKMIRGKEISLTINDAVDEEGKVTGTLAIIKISISGA